jgi:uncharacterized protein
MALELRSPGVFVEEIRSGTAPIAGVGTSTAGFIGKVDDVDGAPTGKLPALNTPRLYTNFGEFRAEYGDFSATDKSQNTLAHAVFGFFNNGGTRCWVVRADATSPDLDKALEAIDPIDEVAILAAPGIAVDKASWGKIATHCFNSKTRFGILDASKDDDWRTPPPADDLPSKSDYAALYFPWIQVFDPGSKALVFVPPSGHLAGVYARVDTQRGVHKAPANEAVFGAVGLQFPVSQRKQDGLNPIGVNCIRSLNGTVTVWGARTANSTDSDEFKYVSTRRLFNFLRASIDRGTQWAVFEPNNPDLWAKIIRNVGAFLTQVWAGGALFGTKPEEAFFIKCDEENNPPATRELGMVVADIGVAITKPAEFVVFRLGQR